MRRPLGFLDIPATATISRLGASLRCTTAGSARILDLAFEMAAVSMERQRQCLHLLAEVEASWASPYGQAIWPGAADPVIRRDGH